MGSSFSSFQATPGEEDEFEYVPGSNRKHNETILKGIEAMQKLSMQELERKFGTVYAGSKQRLNSMLNKPESQISARLASCLAENRSAMDKCFAMVENNVDVDEAFSGRPPPATTQFEEIDEMELLLIEKQQEAADEQVDEESLIKQ